jgi:hypothetical protein
MSRSKHILAWVAAALFLGLPCMAAGPASQPAATSSTGLGARPVLSSGLEWIQRERLRGTLFHQPIVDPMPPAHLQVASAPSGDATAGVVLRGEHFLTILVEKEKAIRFRLETIQTQEQCPVSIYALFGPDGRTLAVGQVEKGKPALVEAAAPGPGRHILLVNPGIASHNVARVSVEDAAWAVEAAQRSAYLRTPLVYHFLRELKTAGLNLAMLDFEALPQEFVTDEGLAKWARCVEAWADEARRYDIRFMPALDLGGSPTEVEAWGDAPKGMYPKQLADKPLAPCPLARVWWERVFLRRAKEVARLSTRNPCVVGIGIDPEMYQCWDYGHYMPSGTCYCDRCLGGFLGRQGLDATLLKELSDGKSRQDWLEKHKLYAAYDGYLADEMARLAASLRDELHAINPEFLICVFVLDSGNWFCRGLARGLGTQKVPVVNFCETTYYGVGYDPQFIDRTAKAFRNWGANVTAGYAVWDIFFPPTLPGYLAAHCYNLAWKGDGYWFWPGCDLLIGDADYRRWSYQGKLPYVSDYWLALKDANNQIERRIAGGDQYVSPLDNWQPIPWRGAHDETTGQWKKDTPVKRQNDRLYPIHLAEPCSFQFFVLDRVRAFTILARAEGGDGSLKVLSPGGRAVGEQACQAGREVALAVSRGPDDKPGLWTLQVTPPKSAQGAMALDLGQAPPYLTPAGGRALAPQLKDGDLLGRWRFDEGRGATAVDSSGPPAHDGQIIDATWAQGKSGQALSFDGKASHVQIRHNWDLDILEEFTMTAWVNLRSLPTKGHGATILCKGPEAPVQHCWWWIGYDQELVLEVGSEKHAYGTGFSTQKLSWELGRWYQVAVTFRCDGNATTAALYRDGQQLYQNTLQEAFHTGAHDLLIGAYDGGSMHVLNGLIDEVTIYRRRLSAQEIAKLAGP